MTTDLDLHAENVRLEKLLTTERARSQRLIYELELAAERLASERDHRAEIERVYNRAVLEITHLQDTVYRLQGDAPVEKYIPRNFSQGVE